MANIQATRPQTKILLNDVSLIDALERLNRNTIDKLDTLAGTGTTERLREGQEHDGKPPDADV